MSEFNLSEKIFEFKSKHLFGEESSIIDVEYVKEFIRLLKEKLCSCQTHPEGHFINCDECRQIDKLAGEELVEGGE